MTFAPQRACTCKDERAGRDYLRNWHEAASLLQRDSSPPHKSNYTKMSSRQAAATILANATIKGPGRSELILAGVRSLGHHRPRDRPLFTNKPEKLFDQTHNATDCGAAAAGVREAGAC
jgi:hypothetical protein